MCAKHFCYTQKCASKSVFLSLPLAIMIYGIYAKFIHFRAARRQSRSPGACPCAPHVWNTLACTCDIWLSVRVSVCVCVAGEPTLTRERTHCRRINYVSESPSSWSSAQVGSIDLCVDIAVCMWVCVCIKSFKRETIAHATAAAAATGILMVLCNHLEPYL